MYVYDAVIVLGSKPNTQTWEFPSHITSSLMSAANLWNQSATPYIIVSGKWALSFEQDGIAQPYRECDQMAEQLIQLGVSPDAILREGNSKDTISNLYYIKRQLLRPMKLQKILFIVAEFRKTRLEYLAAKILGSNYVFSIQTVACPPAEIYPNESKTLAHAKKFLSAMADGDDGFLDDKLYTSEYYQSAPQQENAK